VDLQANYIAALLDDDVYVPIGGTASAIYIAGWFLTVQLVFVFMRRLWVAALICAGVWTLVFIASLVLLSYLGRLFTFWFQGVNFGVILLTWVEHWLHGMSSHQSDTKAATAEVPAP